MGYTEEFGFDSRDEKIFFSGSGAHPCSYPMGTRDTFSGGKAHHSPPCSAEIKNTWIYISTPPHIFMAYSLMDWAQGLYLLYT
jgi:hypothetical protein